MTWHAETTVKGTVCVFITVTRGVVPLPVCRSAAQEVLLHVHALS